MFSKKKRRFGLVFHPRNEFTNCLGETVPRALPPRLKEAVNLAIDTHNTAWQRGEKGRKRTKGGRRLLNRLLPRWIKANGRWWEISSPPAMDPRAMDSLSLFRERPLCAAPASGMHRRSRNRVQIHPTLSDETCNDRQRSLATLKLHVVSRTSRACLVHSPSARWIGQVKKKAPLESASTRQTVEVDAAASDAVSKCGRFLRGARKTVPRLTICVSYRTIERK